MNENTWLTVMQIAQVLLGLISGIGAVRIIDVIKNSLHIEGYWATLTTVTIAVVLAVLNLIVAEQLTPVPLTADSIVAIFGTIYAASQAEYIRLRKAQGAE